MRYFSLTSTFCISKIKPHSHMISSSGTAPRLIARPLCMFRKVNFNNNSNNNNFKQTENFLLIIISRQNRKFLKQNRSHNCFPKNYNCILKLLLKSKTKQVFSTKQLHMYFN